MQDQSSIPFGYCRCGCGERTTLAPYSRKSRGTVKGQPHRFIKQHQRRVALSIRFWKKVEKTDSCWLWRGSTNSDGYGTVGVDGRTIGAHIVAYRLTYGEVPEGRALRHTCDVRNCVRPTHLIPGTQLENMRDAVERGRMPRGHRTFFARHPELAKRTPKLTVDQVCEIRARYAQGGVSYKSLAGDYGVGLTTILAIVRRLSWREVD